MNKLILILLLMANIITAQESDIDRKILKMFELNGSKANFELVINNMIDLQSKEYESIISEEFFTELKSEILKEGSDSLTVKILPIYKEVFTEKEIDGIILFLESDSGKALTEKTPILLEKSMAVGAEWGEALGEKIINKITTSNEVKMNLDLGADCLVFQEGIYEDIIKIDENEELLVIVERKGNEQSETVNGEVLKQRIEWLSDCKYTLTGLEDDGNLKENDTVIVNIIEITKDGYSYIVKKENINFYSEGKLTKIK